MSTAMTRPIITNTTTIKKSTPNRAFTTTSPALTPLELPELLSKLLSFVDQKTLRTSIVLVSHLWLLTSRPLIIRELVWEEFDSAPRGGVEKVLKKLPYAGRLFWNVCSTRSFPRPNKSGGHDSCLVLGETLRKIQGQRGRWGTETGAGTGIRTGTSKEASTPSSVAAEYAKQGGEGGHPYDYLTSLFAREPLVLRQTPLQELFLSARCNILEQFTKLAPYIPSTLTDLRLRQVLSGTIQVGPILQACPHIRVLHLGSGYFLDVQAPWLPPVDLDDDSETGAGAATMDEPRHSRRALLLTTLVLENPQLRQAEIEQFFASTPHLRVLKLINLHKQVPPNGLNPQYDGRQLVNRLKTLNIRLQTFHFSMSREKLANAAMDELMVVDGMDGSSTEWDFGEGSLTPRLMQHIGQLPNRVTSLTFHVSIHSHHTTMPLLHQFLCDNDSSVYLVHLRAPKTTYPIAHMDLFRRIPDPFNPLITSNRVDILAEIKATQRGVWKCRNLETLHIGFEISGGWGTRHQPEQSRVVFGYISRVLPRLVELFIHTDVVYNYVFPIRKLRLEGGFCLLARLRFLERLKICNERYTPLPPRQVWDLEWMVKDGWRKEGKEKRRRAMAPWRTTIKLEDEKETKRVARAERVRGTSDGHGDVRSECMKWEAGVDEALRVDLQHLGRLLDVKLWLDDMVSPGNDSGSSNDGGDGISDNGSKNKPWPSLKSMAIACAFVYGLPPAAEFYRLDSAREYGRFENRR